MTPDQRLFSGDDSIKDVTASGAWISFGQGARAQIIEGRPFGIKDLIDVSDSLSFIVDPTRIEMPKSVEHELGQTTLFDEEPSDLPEGLYEYLRILKAPTLQEAEHELEGRLSSVEKVFLKPALRYLRYVKGIGEEESLSRRYYGLNISFSETTYGLNGSVRKTLDLRGKADEVRKAQEAVAVIRIRKKRGRPTPFDFVRVALTAKAYQAANRGVNLPQMFVFNLTDGQLVRLTPLKGFYKDSLDAIFYSALSERAGYPMDQAGRIVIKTPTDTTDMTPEEAFEKARNSMKSLVGKTKRNNKKYRVTEVLPGLQLSGLF